MSRNTRSLAGRVAKAAEDALARQRYVAPVDVLAGMGWLAWPHVDSWRKGRHADLTELAAVPADRLTEAVRALVGWATSRDLVPNEVSYVSATRDRHALRFTAEADPELERLFRTHWISPALPEAKREQMTKKQSAAPDLVVIEPLKEFVCTSCGGEDSFLIMDNGEPVCMTCADMAHLVFLPSGDATLTRRAKKASGLSAVVVRFSRARKRYERQGILVEEEALDLAEEQCLADEEVRLRRRERDQVRREDGDLELQARLAKEVVRLLPGCPVDRAEAIARHTGVRGSGRVGRSAAGRALDDKAVTAAVIASVRHTDTRYDELLMSGVARVDARDQVRDDIDRVLAAWRAR